MSEDAAGGATPDPFQAFADELLERAEAAQQAFAALDQAATDRIVRAVARACFEAAPALAEAAVEETGMGIVADKRFKNEWAAEAISRDLEGRITVGVVREDQEHGLTEVLVPVGPVLALTPVTNPTSTVIAKALIACKSRNALIVSPHRGARNCSKEAARIAYDAAREAGAPEHAIQTLTKAQSDYLDRVMRHRRLGMILATSTSGIVQQAERSGTPTLGVGPGNVPVYVDDSAALEGAARGIVKSKTFDYGTVCASEQALVLEPGVARALRSRLAALGAHFCTPAEALALGAVCFDPEKRTMRAEVVGRAASVIAGLAGFSVPSGTTLLLADPGGVGREFPLSHEILAPVLAWIEVPDRASALETCRALLRLGGRGHTLGIWAEDAQVVSEFARLPAARILVNQPTTQGAIGGITGYLRPSLSLACGSGARNHTSDNLSVEHLLEVRRISRLRPEPRWN